ncbi:MAG TPA: DciA family protein, partial [Candidatus Polarisedimenticolaceae bacterium]|nr:DciA family protein [Candidatus Polarisedimenticolaceae bacterium]
ARALAIEAAWRAAAGPSIARRAVVRRLARGVLEIDVAEAAWRRVLVQILPEIEARLRRDHPALAIEHLRMMDD